MRYINHNEFDFIPNWDKEDKKYFAAFFYKIKKYYTYIEDKEYLCFIKEKLFKEFKKNNNLTISSKLFGTIKMSIFRLNEKRKKEKEALFIQSMQITHIYCTDDKGEQIYIANLISDISKICNKKTAFALVKKMYQDKLTNYEYKLLQKHKKTLNEYAKL